MSDRRHLWRDEDADKEQSPAPRREQRENSETASILDLQSSAGNRAVAQLLKSRETTPVPAVQRDWGDPKPREEPKDSGPTATGTMTVPDLELVVPILSFSRQAGSPNQPKTESGVASVTIPIDVSDVKIHEAVIKGKHFATVTIAIASRSTITLHDVVFSDIQLGREMAQVSMDFASMDVRHSG